MKLLKQFRFPTIVLAATAAVFADNTVEAHWSQECRVADGKQLMLTTTDGQQINGYCFRVNADTLALKTLDKHTVTIARKAIAGMRLRTERGRQVAALGKGVRAGVHQGHIWLFSPHAIAGLIAIPSTLAWGAMSLPFCILGDIGAPNVPDKDLKLVADKTAP